MRLLFFLFHRHCLMNSFVSVQQNHTQSTAGVLIRALDSINTDGLELLPSVIPDSGADQPSISIHEVRSLRCSDLAYGQWNLGSQFTSSPPSLSDSSFDSSIESTSPGNTNTTSVCSTSSGENRAKVKQSLASNGQIRAKETSHRLQQNGTRLPVDFRVMPLRHLVQQKVENKKMDSSVRKSIVSDNCNAVWQFTQQLDSEGRKKMAIMIVEKYPFLKQPNDPPEVLI